MPELPEVEVLMRFLDPRLRTSRITDVAVVKERITRPDPSDAVAGALAGGRIRRLSRAGKYLVLEIEKDRGPDRLRRILLHLGMTGRLYLQPCASPRPRFAAATIGLVRRRRRETLVFDDVRLLGRLTLDTRPLDRLGLEPLSSAFTEAALRSGLTRSAQPVKPRLLNQGVVAGLGNIYVCEALFAANLNPRTPSRSLNAGQIRRLHSAIQRVLRQAVDFGSGLNLDWTGAPGNDGLFYFGESRGATDAPSTERFAVYDRAGERCRKCDDVIVRFVMAGRSTYHCPTCQSS